jgi:hypothetical protein
MPNSPARITGVEVRLSSKVMRMVSRAEWESERGREDDVFEADGEVWCEFGGRRWNCRRVLPTELGGPPLSDTKLTLHFNGSRTVRPGCIAWLYTWQAHQA